MPHYNQYTHQPARISLLMKRLKESPLTSNESIWPYSVVASTTFEATFAVSIGSYWGIFWGVALSFEKTWQCSRSKCQSVIGKDLFCFSSMKVETDLPFSQTKTLKSKMHFISNWTTDKFVFFFQKKISFFLLFHIIIFLPNLLIEYGLTLDGGCAHSHQHPPPAGFHHHHVILNDVRAYSFQNFPWSAVKSLLLIKTSADEFSLSACCRP
jgi:hypothetical protein